jgi:hypothetical protein
MCQRGIDKMSLCYDFQKWTILTLGLIAITLTTGLVGIAYGQESNSTQQDNGTSIKAELWKHDGEYYCYDANTTTKKQVLNADEDGLTYLNEVLSYLAKDDLELAKPICEGMLEQGTLPADCHCAVIHGTLTIEPEEDD